MAIARVMDQEIVQVGENHRLMDLIEWLDAQKLTIRNDFNYGGVEKGRYQFSFVDKNNAMMFKLAFGGL